MRAVVLKAFGEPDRLVAEEVPDPQPVAGEALVRVAAAGVCYADLLMRQGAYPSVKPPAILGHEFAGEVAAVGAGVTTLRPGDRVVATVRIFCGSCRYCVTGLHNHCARAAQFGEQRPGAYAEYVASPVSALLPVPPAVSLEEAACLSCAAGTAMHALREAALTPGDTVVVNGASGGVGSHAVQLARLAGARVIAVTTAAGKADALARLGADEVIVSPGLDYAPRVKELTGGEGADVVLEMLGSLSLAASLSSVRRGGRVVLVGSIEPTPTPFRPPLVILKQLTLKGVSGGGQPRDLRQLLLLVEQGRLKPVVGGRLPLERAADAHREMAARRSTGRLLLVP